VPRVLQPLGARVVEGVDARRDGSFGGCLLLRGSDLGMQADRAHATHAARKEVLDLVMVLVIQLNSTLMPNGLRLGELVA